MTATCPRCGTRLSLHHERPLDLVPEAKALDTITPDAIVLVCPEEGVLARSVADRGVKATAEGVA